MFGRYLNLDYANEDWPVLKMHPYNKTLSTLGSLHKPSGHPPSQISHLTHAIMPFLSINLLRCLIRPHVIGDENTYNFFLGGLALHTIQHLISTLNAAARYVSNLAKFSITALPPLASVCIRVKTLMLVNFYVWHILYFHCTNLSRRGFAYYHS